MEFTANTAEQAAPDPVRSAVYYDGKSSRKRTVVLAFGDKLVISGEGLPSESWDYADIRRADGAPGVLRVSCLSASPLARLEIRDATLAADLESRCARLGDNSLDGRSIARIVGWSLAAAASIVLVILFAIPLAADRLTPLVPASFERRLGDAADAQMKAVFGGHACKAEAGQAALVKLVDALRKSSGLDLAVEPAVLDTPIPNAFALPGGKVYLLKGLLAKADDPDEIAGVLAHELGHLAHRDSVREVIYNGGTSFLVGLLFGDVTGSSTLIFASRSLVTATYSREAEQNADSFAIEVMQRLGRSPKPMGELLFRVTGKEGDNPLSILASHPLTEDRLKRMSELDRQAAGPPLLTRTEWTELKSICGPVSKT
ncbi:MAG: M48 family metallopeptidase [Bradyrhizobium sp.]|uniref:M48 family metallopeptidase n=1 Tax=Bradyrhizobium sp. TaxID=376 RepID=UPI001D31A3F6|nr:M48 family metallopeptidase [Bradyrhizobium sp.]MBV9562564.1 M48 family metallopeptidase [Bradyrhizobium sp.]